MVVDTQIHTTDEMLNYDVETLDKLLELDLDMYDPVMSPTSEQSLLSKDLSTFDLTSQSSSAPNVEWGDGSASFQILNTATQHDLTHPQHQQITQSFPPTSIPTEPQQFDANTAMSVQQQIPDTTAFDSAHVLALQTHLAVTLGWDAARTTEVPNIPQYKTDVRVASACESSSSLSLSWRCIECRMSFPDGGALKAHRRKHHPKPKRYPCHYASCSVRFSAKCNLSKHLKSVHLKQRPHACGFPQCGRRFSERNKLLKHEETVHFGARPFECEYTNCNQVFGQKSDRTRHVNVVHLGERRYVCIACSKAFGRKSSLAQHLIRIHGMKRPAADDLLAAAQLQCTNANQHLAVRPPLCGSRA